jgi:hypothetical protein
MMNIPPIDYELLYTLHPELRGVFVEKHEEDYYPDWDAVKEADC